MSDRSGKSQGTGQLLQPYAFACRQTLLKTTSYKQECLNIQIDMLDEQVGELKSELFDYFDQKGFKMSEGLGLVYKSSVASKDWLVLANQCK